MALIVVALCPTNPHQFALAPGSRLRNSSGDPETQYALRVPDNPLLQLKPEEISLLRFGETHVEYKVSGRTFKLTFASREVMDGAVEQWIMAARERGEFFRLEALKSTHQRQIRHMRRKKPLA